MKHVTLKWNRGEEAVCPECGNRNACLHTGNLGTTTVYECRDCHSIFVTSNAACPGHPDHDKNFVQDALLVKRTLGKTCSGCGSFGIVPIDYEERARLNVGAKYSWEMREYKCQDCGRLWG